MVCSPTKFCVELDVRSQNIGRVLNDWVLKQNTYYGILIFKVYTSLILKL